MTAALTLGALALAVSPAEAGPAERKKAVDNSISELSEDLVGTSKELQAAYAALAAAQGRLPGAQAELAAAEQRRDEAQRKDAELASRLAAAQESEANQAKEIEDGREELSDTESTIGRIAAQAYRSGGLTSGLSLALGSQGPEDFADRYLLVDTALRSQSSAMARLQQQQAVLANQRARLEAVREQVAQLREEARKNFEVARQAEKDAAERKAEVESLIQEQTQATTAIKARQAEEQAQLDKLKQEQAALAAELKRIAEEERRREAERRAREQAAAERARKNRANRADRAPAPPPRRSYSSGSILLRPTNTRITSSYGWRIHPIYGYRRMHTGTDFGGPCGVPIRAAEDGRVVRAGWAGGYGNQVVVSHGIVRGDALATSYNHMSRYAVRSGYVSRGEVIGYIGTTGASTGCHLHFEVFVNGDRTDPMRYL